MASRNSGLLVRLWRSSVAPLWGRASRLPFSLGAVGIACPGDRGTQRHVGNVSPSSGVPEHRPSGPPPAAQRRTIGVVVRRTIEGLRPRRWHAGGLLPSRYSRTGRRLPEVAPLDVFRGATGCLSAPPGKTSRTARPVGRHKSTDPGAGPRHAPVGRHIVWIQGRPRHTPVCVLVVLSREHVGLALTGRAVLDQCSALRGVSVGWNATPIIVNGGNLGQPR